MTFRPRAPAIREPVTAQIAAAASVEQVLRRLDSSADELSGAQACECLAQYRRNVIRTQRVSAWAVLVRQLNNAVLILLAATAVLSYFLGDHNQALIIGVILAASIGLGFFNQYRAEIERRAARFIHSGTTQ
jgi:P-type Mg2+ transporter